MTSAVTDADVDALIQLYASKLGMKLDRTTGYERLTALVRQVDLIYRPIKVSAVANMYMKNGDDNEYGTSTKTGPAI